MKRWITGMLLITACTREAELPATQPIAHAMFYNGSADFYNRWNYVSLNNDSMLSLTYNSAATELIGALNYASYQLFRPGTYRISFSDTADVRDKITDAEIDLQPGRHQTIYLADSLGYFETIVSDDEVARDSSIAYIRLVHLAPDAPKVSMVIDTTGVPEIDSVTYRQITPFVKIAPNPKPGFRIRYNDNGEEKTLVRKSFSMLGGRTYTFVLRGYMQPADGNPNKTINLSAIINQ
ncbi:DUF4397 domain-containing protein [Chitinophaga cymbidii]|uniref:DUF4397 domain-containing protein n=1 Tax=Chitinophaga cymbidii TaxID=1096750 RepID=A0A512RFF6_9BACT|nr:DUF4397 domain-containing protein [Chitinophaga cymbidii]GEP94432.1 hypothetical protein CCY01nite_06920 [Chitinophaga cymbidii]